MAAKDPSDRVMFARMGAHAQHAKYSGVDTTAASRATFLARFEREVDPDGVLSPAERAHRAECAKRLHFLRMAQKSAQARRLKSARWQIRAKADAEPEATK